MLRWLWNALQMAGLVLALVFSIGGIACLGLIIIMLVVNMFR